MNMDKQDSRVWGVMETPWEVRRFSAEEELDASWG